MTNWDVDIQRCRGLQLDDMKVLNCIAQFKVLYFQFIFSLPANITSLLWEVNGTCLLYVISVFGGY